MEINAANLTHLYTGFNAAFQGGIGIAPTQYEQISTTAPSTTAEEEYGWLGKVPGMREWIGDRVVHSLATHDYRIRNKDWEDTIGVSRPKIEDDTYGIYAPMFGAMGEAGASHPNELMFSLLKDGFTVPCYDRQPFFDADHPVLDTNGQPQSVSNTGGGGGTPWYLLALNRYLKPVIYQPRRKLALTRMDDLKDQNVFMRQEFLYGSDARYNGGYGLWQLAYASRQELNAVSFGAGFAAMESMTGDYGRPLGLTPTHLLVPPRLRVNAMDVLKSERNTYGASNIWRDSVELIVSPWLL